MGNKFEALYRKMMQLSDEQLLAQLEFDKKTAQIVQHHLNIQTNERILDLCCGSGGLSCLLAKQGFDVVGIDFVEQALEVGRRIQTFLNCDVSFQVGDITQRNSLPDKADVILLCDVVFPSAFSHSGNESLVANLAYCLAPEGRIFIEAYNKDYCIKSGFENYVYDCQTDCFVGNNGDSVILYDFEETSSLFARYGLKIDKCGGWGNFFGEKGLEYQSQADYFIVTN